MYKANLLGCIVFISSSVGCPVIVKLGGRLYVDFLVSNSYKVTVHVWLIALSYWLEF